MCSPGLEALKKAAAALPEVQRLFAQVLSEINSGMEVSD
jgi:hypothetical protein